MSLVFTSAVQFCGCTEPPIMSASLTFFESKPGTSFKGDLSYHTLYALSHIMEKSELSCLEDMLQKLSSALLTAPHRTNRVSLVQVPLKYNSGGYWSSAPNASDCRLTFMTLNHWIRQSPLLSMKLFCKIHKLNEHLSIGLGNVALMWIFTA